jgi:uncharacterized DUF497 family protein
MEIEFDAVKDRINREKHGISLALAAEIDIAAALVRPDRRRDYGELRFVAIAPVRGRLHVLAFTMRGDWLRAISLRRANERERMRYEHR